MTNNYLLSGAWTRYVRHIQFLLLGLFLLGNTTSVNAQTIYALSGNNLISFNAASPAILAGTVPVTGITAGQDISGLDFRPNTGQLYALGYNNTTGAAQLYTIDRTTGAATVLNAIPTQLQPDMGKIGFDFNPTVDRIRVTGSNNANYRLHPVTGLIAATDMSLAFAAGDANAGVNPSVGAVAYTNSYIGAATTTLFNYDDSLNVVTTQVPPNNGTLNTLGSAGITVHLDDPTADLDVFFDNGTGTNKAFLVANTDGQSNDNLYTVNLLTGAATLIGAIGVPVSDIAVLIDRTLPPLTGQLVYALTSNNNLISFDAAAPALIRTIVAVTGVISGQVIVGMDTRPATGELFVLGYNAATGEARLYVLNPGSGVVTAVGAAPIQLKAGMGKVSLDFNPTVDRIRVTGSDNSNYRPNPITGGIAATDGNLAFAAGDASAGADPSIGAVAYTNSYIGATTTTLLNYDDSLNVFTTQIPPNNGILNTIGISGITVNLADQSTDLDIFYDVTSGTNKIYFTANPSGQTTDFLYTFSPSTGITLIDKIGFGIPVNDIAIAIDRTIPTLTGHLVYALTANNSLISFDSDLPGVVRSLVTVTGITAGQQIMGMDARPATGELFILGYNATTGEAQLYTLNPTTGITTAVGAAPIQLKPAMGKISLDFNPTVDRIRVTGSDNSNYRLNPITGAIAATDGNLAFAAGDVNTGVNPSIGAGAYTNSYIGTTTTTLYNYDDSLNVFTTQIPPNNGTLNTISTSGITVNTADPTTDLDVFYDAQSSANAFYFVANTGTQTSDDLYTFNPATGLNIVGKIGLGIAVYDIAVAIDRVVPDTLTGRLIYALTANNSLISFDSDLPGVVRSLVAVTGITAGQQIMGMDARPATGELFILGYNATTGDAQLYSLNPTTGITTAVGAAPIQLKPAMGKISLDFNPTVDRIRVTGSDNSNYRLNPITGGIAATDGNLAFAAGDVNAGVNPSIGAGAYTNSYIGTTTTTLYNYDDSLNVFTTQIPPNNGTLNTIGTSGITVNTADPTTDLDVFYDAANSANAFYFVANTGTKTADDLYTFNPATGLTLVGKIGLGIAVYDIAVAIDRNVPTTVTGQLVYALTANNSLIAFDSDLPGVVRSLVVVTGVTTGQTLVGMDFRPATGALFALGYNSATGEARLYTINLMTGVATLAGTETLTLALGAGDVGFDFNPTVDRIRVVGANNANYRLNPITGGLAATDGNLNFAATDVNAGKNPAVGAVAYTNSYNTATTTTLYNYDDSLNVLLTQMPPNNGTLNTVGATGITLNPADPSVDLDIYYDHQSGINRAYLSANTGSSSSDNFYTLDLATGATTPVGLIGQGIAVRDIAVLIDSLITVSIQEVVQENKNNLLVYPNPATETAFINFELPASVEVRVVVTDVAGRVVSTLLTGNVASGKQQVTWDITAQTAGMYFIQLYLADALHGTAKVVVRR